MIAANRPVQRPSNAKVLMVDRKGNIEHHVRSELANLLRPGDVVVANDAATLPASLPVNMAAAAARLKCVLRAAPHSTRSGSILLSCSGRATSAPVRKVGLNRQH